MNSLEDDGDLSRRAFLVGTAGTVAAAGTAGTALAQEGGDEGGEGDDGGAENESGGGAGGGGGTETVQVVDNAFEPEEITIEPGTTVEWAWQSTTALHNVHPTAQPDEASWEGHLSLEDGDFSFESTFDVEGEYEYQCDPHAPGMSGTVIVTSDASAMAEGPIDLVPDAAWSLLIASVAGMVSVLSLAYAFMRYGGNPPE